MGIKLSTNFDVQAVSLPLDLRFVVADLVDLNNMDTQYRYKGLMTYVESENKYYYLKDNLDDWIEFESGGGNVDYEYTVGTGGVQAFQVVFLSSSNTVMVADYSDITIANLVVGVALETGIEGDTIKVRHSGRITNNEWSYIVSSQDVVFVGISGYITNDVSGLVSGFYQKLGIMENENTLLLDINDCVILR